jgi:hypothetical protein
MAALAAEEGSAETAIALTHPVGRRSIKPLREK